MNKEQYELRKKEIIERLGVPEYDMRDPVNDSARELSKLTTEFKAIQRFEKVLNEDEQKKIVKKYASVPAVPIYLTDTDLELFTEQERPVVEDYFQDRNQTALELSKKHKGYTRNKVVALLRSGPFSTLCNRVFGPLAVLELQNAILKAIRDGDTKIIERMAEQMGVMKSPELKLNINKPLQFEDNPEIMKQIKELGDRLADL